jgi:hypothetical protein
MKLTIASIIAAVAVATSASAMVAPTQLELQAGVNAGDYGKFTVSQLANFITTNTESPRERN